MESIEDTQNKKRDDDFQDGDFQDEDVQDGDFQDEDEQLKKNHLSMKTHSIVCAGIMKKYSTKRLFVFYYNNKEMENIYNSYKKKLDVLSDFTDFVKLLKDKHVFKMGYVSQKVMYGMFRFMKNKNLVVSTILKNSSPISDSLLKESFFTGFSVKAFLEKGFLKSYQVIESLHDLSSIMRFDNKKGLEFTSFAFGSRGLGKYKLLSLAPINRLYINPVTRQLNIIADSAEIVDRHLFINTILFYRIAFGQSGASPARLQDVEFLVAMNDSLNNVKQILERRILRQRRDILYDNDRKTSRSISATKRRSSSGTKRRSSSGGTKRRSSSRTKKRLSSH